MRLNKNSRHELREHIYQKLKDIPNGIRIKIPRNVLEIVLFETIESSIDKKTKKILAFDYKYLGKIDLSEITLDNVVISPNDIWLEREELSGKSLVELSPFVNAEYDMLQAFAENPILFDVNCDLNPQTIPGKNLISLSFEGMDMSKYSFDNVNLRFTNLKNTNANINLQKINDGEFSGELMGCDFENTNLYGIIDDSTYEIYDCNFKGTNITVKTLKNSRYCNFEGLDLSGVLPSELKIIHNNLKGTKARIELDKLNWNDIDIVKFICDMFGLDYIGNVNKLRIEEENGQIYLISYDEKRIFEVSVQQVYQEYIKYLFKENKLHYLEGCYINGVLFEETEEYQRLKARGQILEDYEKYEQTFYEEIDTAFETGKIL